MNVLVALWAAVRALPWWSYAAVVLVVLGLWWGEHRHSQGEAQVQAQWDAAEAKAAAAAANREADWRNSIYHLAYAAEQRRIEREQETERTVAELRDGTLRLRDRFRCPVVPASPGAAGQPVAAEAGGLRVEDAELLVRLADEADTIADERNQCIASYKALTSP